MRIRKIECKNYMKSKYYTTLAALGIFACAAQADITNIYGGLSDTEATEIKADAENLDVVLNPNQTDTSAEAFFKGNGNTISSLKTSGTPSNWNIASGKTTIDINQAGSGEFDAFINTGTMTFAEGTALEIVNSAGNSAIANVDLGTLSLAESYDSSNHGLIFKTNATVTGTSFSATTNGSRVPAISVSNNSTVDYRVATSSFINGAIISVDKGSTLNVYEKLSTDNQGIRFKVDGTLNYESSFVILRDAQITGTFSAQQIYFNGGTSKLSGNGVINAVGPIYIGKNLTISDNATVKLTKETVGVQSKIILNSNGNLTISAKNAISYEGGLADIRVSGAKQAASLTISADNMFNNLIFNKQDYNEYLNLTVNNGAKVYFNAIEFDSTVHTATLTIKSFSEFSIFFKDISGWDEIDSVALSDTEGNTYTKDDLKWIAGKYDGIDGYWLSTVPEPATYAAVFGALALSLAIYRRRK